MKDWRPIAIAPAEAEASCSRGRSSMSPAPWGVDDWPRYWLSQWGHLWLVQRGRGMYTRTVQTPVFGRALVIFVSVQASISVASNVFLAVEPEHRSCLATIYCALLSLAALFIVYFAVEAVRTENPYQLTASLVTSTVLWLGYVTRLAANDLHNDLSGPGAVTVITVVGALQLCAATGPTPCTLGRRGACVVPVRARTTNNDA